MSEEIQKKIQILKQTQQQVINIHNKVCRETPVDADSGEVIAAAARVIIAERKMHLIDQELTLLESQIHINKKAKKKSKKKVVKKTRKKGA